MPTRPNARKQDRSAEIRLISYNGKTREAKRPTVTPKARWHRCPGFGRPSRSDAGAGAVGAAGGAVVEPLCATSLLFAASPSLLLKMSSHQTQKRPASSSVVVRSCAPLPHEKARSFLTGRQRNYGNAGWTGTRPK